MVRKNWIVIGLCITAGVMLCAAAYAEKGEKECSLSAAVQAAVKALFPNAVIGKCKMEEEMKMYEVKVKDGNKESEVKLAVDGTVAEVETVEDINALPAAVAKTLKAHDAKVSKAEKSVEQAQLKLVKLDVPITTYEAKINNKDGEKIEIKVAADGTIIKQEAEKKECNKGKDKDDDDKDEHEIDKD
ncbi:MAG: hypothetical protein WAK60_00570 [Sedimentisphaerales bacterium]